MKTLLLLVAVAVAAPLWVFSQNQPPPAAAPARDTVQAPQYKIVVDTSAEGLAIKVNELMVAGWQPAGGVAVEAGGFYQAMTPSQRRRVVEPTR